MYIALAGICAEQEANAGGGGGGTPTPEITIATAATGNFNNAIKLAVLNTNTMAYDGTSTGVFDGSSSTFGTASNPTRTTQNQNISATDLRDNAYFNGSGFLQSIDAIFVFGCYIRHNGTNATNFQVRVSSGGQNGLISHSTTNSTLQAFNVSTTYANQQDSTTFGQAGQMAMQSGFYDMYGFQQQGHYLWNLQLSGKSGNVPQAGDSFTIRIVANATVDGTACQATHDITITLT